MTESSIRQGIGISFEVNPGAGTEAAGHAARSRHSRGAEVRAQTRMSTRQKGTKLLFTEFRAFCFNQEIFSFCIMH
jgi:hypothetical protein